MATGHIIGQDVKLDIDKSGKTGTITFKINKELSPSSSGKMDMILSISGFQYMNSELDGKPIKANLQIGVDDKK